MSMGLSPSGASKKRSDSSSSNPESWDIFTLEAETSATFSFSKPNGLPSSGFSNPNRAGGPPPAPPLNPASSSPFFQIQQPTIGAPPALLPQNPHHQQASSSSATKPAPNRSHAPPLPSPSSSSSTPSDPSKTWVSRPSQLLQPVSRPESTRPGGGPHNVNSSSTHSPSSTKHRPPPPPNGSPSRAGSSSRHGQVPSNKQAKTFGTQQQQPRTATGEERTKSSTDGRGGTGDARRIDLEQDELTDEGLGSSLGSSKGKTRAGDKVPSGQGFGAYAGAKTSFEQRPPTASGSSTSRGGAAAATGPTVSEFFASPPTTNCHDDPIFDEPNDPPRPSSSKQPATKNPPVSKPPPTSTSTGRRSHSARPEEAPKHVSSRPEGGAHPANPEVVVVGSSSGQGQRARSKPISQTNSGNSLRGGGDTGAGGGGAALPRGGGGTTKRKVLPEGGGGGGASGSGGRKPAAAATAGGGERKKRPNDEDKENPRRKVSRVVRDLEETVAQFEGRGEEITRLKHEIGNHEKKHEELEGQVAMAKKLVGEMRRKLAGVEKTVTEIIESKRDLDASRLAMAKEVEGYQAYIAELDEWDTDRKDALRSEDSWFNRQRKALRETIDPLQVKAVEAEARAAEARTSLEFLKKDLVTKSSDLAEKSNRVGYLEEECSKKDSTIRSLGNKLDNIDQRNHSSVEELNKELKTLKERLIKAEGNTRDLEGAVAESERELEDCKAQLPAKDPELPVLQQKIAGLERSLQEKERSVNDLRRDIETQTKAVEEAKRTSEAFRMELGNVRSRLKELEGHLSQSTEDLKAAREEGKAAVEEKEEKIKSLAEALEEFKTENNETNRKLAVTNTKLEERDQLLKGTEGRVKDLIEDKKTLEKSNENLHKNVQDLISGGTTSSSDTSHSRSEVDTLNQKLRDAEAAGADSAAQLRKVSGQFTDLERRIETISLLESKLAESESKRIAAEQNEEKMKADLAEKTKALASLQSTADSEREAASTSIDKYERQASDLHKQVKELQEKKKTLADRFKNKSGPLDGDEGKVVDQITLAIEASFGNRDVGLGNRIKTLDTKVKTLEREKKDLEAKLAKANVGKARNLIEPDRYAVSSPASEREEGGSSSSSNANRQLDSPTSPSPHNAAAGPSEQPGPLKSALKASSKMLPPPVPSRPSSMNRSDEANPESQEAETQVVALSPPRTSASGAAVPRGAADAASGSRKRGMVLEDLGDYDAEPSTVSAPKKSRNNSTESTSVASTSASAPKAKSQVARRRGK